LEEQPEAPNDPNANWEEVEFGAAKLGDARLTTRLMSLAQDTFAKPQANIPQACGSVAKIKAAYRFFDHEVTTMEAILSPHYKATKSRIREHSLVLAVQDTTSLNYSLHPATTGLGAVGNADDKKAFGLFLHSTLAFNQEGTPLGFIDVQCWARQPFDPGRKKRISQMPLEEKESYKWLASFKELEKVQAAFPKTTFVSIADREADIYELFAYASEKAHGPQILIRSEHDRLLAEGHEKLCATVGNAPVTGLHDVFVPRKANRPARTATVEVRFSKVRLQPPRNKADFPVAELWAVLAQERGSDIELPASQEKVAPIRWMLLTTHPVDSFEAACEKLNWYSRRWGIETFHRVLKAGLRVEERQLRAAHRIQSCLAIDMVVAWRIYYLVHLSRETPDVPCTVYFEDNEWKALLCRTKGIVIPPKQIPTLREITRLLATLGGFIGRKCDGEPGAKSLWLAIQRLDDITATYCLALSQFAPHLLQRPVSSNLTNETG
jgi:hypothetical protein